MEFEMGRVNRLGMGKDLKTRGEESPRKIRSRSWDRAGGGEVDLDRWGIGKLGGVGEELVTCYYSIWKRRKGLHCRI